MNTHSLNFFTACTIFAYISLYIIRWRNYFSYSSIGNLSGSLKNTKRLPVYSSVRIGSCTIPLQSSSSTASAKLSASNARWRRPAASGYPQLEFLSMYYNKLDARSQYRFQYHPTGTGVSYMWYWQRTYMHKSGIPIDVFLVFKVTPYSV